MKVETGCPRRKELWEGALALDLEPAFEGGFPEGSKLTRSGGEGADACSLPSSVPGKTTVWVLGFSL